MIEFKSEFSWSYSRHRIFKTCRRQYYYHYYGSWGGWKDSSDEMARTLYRLKNMVTLPMLAGSIVHQMVSAVLESLKMGHIMSEDKARSEVVRLFKASWRESKKREWEDSPKRMTNLFEHYYQENLDDDTLLDIHNTMVESMRGFYSSDSFAFIKTLSPTEWLAKENLDSFDFQGTKVWAKVDFAARHGDLVYIYDWKTGKGISEDETQLAVYALYAFAKWGIDVKDLRLFDIYLKKQLPVKVKLNDVLIAVAENVMSQSITDMKELLVDELENLAKIDDFPMTDKTGICRRCFFKEVCYPDTWKEL